MRTTTTSSSGGGLPGGEVSGLRGWDEVLTEAVAVLTEAARLRRPVREENPRGEWVASVSRTEPVDWAQFVTLALAGAVANVGSVEKALQARPGSWECERVREVLRSTVGEDPATLLGYRTEPVRVVLRPGEFLADLGYDIVYEESQRVLTQQRHRHVWRYELREAGVWGALDPGAPGYAEPAADWARPGDTLSVPRSGPDQAEWDRLGELRDRLQDLRFEGDPAAYGEALRAAVPAQAAHLFRGQRIETVVETVVEVDRRGWVVDYDGGYPTPERRLVDAVRRVTPLPWSGLTPTDYPLDPQQLLEVERSAGRLPHQRLPPPFPDSRQAPTTAGSGV